VITGLRVDVFPWQLAYYKRLNRMAWTDQADKIASVLREEFANATGRIDSTGVGDAVYSMVLERYGNVVGVNMHAIQVRNAVIERLIGAVEQRKVQVPEEFAGVEQLKREWVAFGAKQLPSGKVRYEAMGKQHDDSVFSLALAVDGAMNIGQPNIYVLQTGTG
jgi:hypothetical protein